MTINTRTCASCGTTIPVAATSCPECGAAAPTEIGQDTEVGRTAQIEANELEYRHRLQHAIGDGYELREVIGRGGMGAVYLAKDLKHGRQVAVKVLRPEITAALGADRFHREIQVTANLQHPHILALYDSGEADGLLFYVMSYVDGETLRDRLDREKKLSVPDVVRITEQVASALSYAHERGVVHRDVKPANILLAGDQAVVADFGIARAVQAAGGEKLTETGIAVGTPAYMSPEQAFGEDDVDGRSDVYALGCVVYEMVGGRTPFDGQTPQAVLAKHAVETAPSLRSMDSSVPLFFDRAVSRALAKEAAQRFESATAFAETLRSKTVVAPVGRKRMAVLPPVNVTNDPDQQFLVLGLHESLISHLGRGDVAVLARTSVRGTPRLRSTILVRPSSCNGAVKLGHPVPESNFSLELKSTSPEMGSTYRPGSLLSQ
jgi:serine/threonine protein kinase